DNEFIKGLNKSLTEVKGEERMMMNIKPQTQEEQKDLSATTGYSQQSSEKPRHSYLGVQMRP
ncbi:hypothetical protein HispidOSU_023306, partial [Sigmodon hispidus]